MDKKMQALIVLGILFLALILLYILLSSNRKNKFKKVLEEVNIRFNKVKTVPLSFKITKARAVAKIEEESLGEVENYYQKYGEAQKHLDALQELINGLEDAYANHKYNEFKKDLVVVLENIKDAEEEVQNIDSFLDRFVEKENEQRAFSNTLKEQFHDVKKALLEIENEITFAWSGVQEKLDNCTKLFSSSEDWMYGNEFALAQKDLETIDIILKDLKLSASALPNLLKESKGVIPIMLDELKRRYALAIQRGLYLNDLDFNTQILGIEKELKNNLAILVKGESTGVFDNLSVIKNKLDNIGEILAQENEAFSQLHKLSDNLDRELVDFTKSENYLEVIFAKEKERYSLQDLEKILPVEKENLQRYLNRIEDYKQKIKQNKTSPSNLFNEGNNLLSALKKDKEYLYEIKQRVDNTANCEARAQNQIIKLQLVLNEITTKISQYNLPTISHAYEEDLAKGLKAIEEIKILLNEIPLSIDKLNNSLNQSIDFIYRLYNNVNNVVGMALMVENAIVFGNKYRSSYPEVDRELSRAELVYLNGEYTSALKIALNALKNLFPNSMDTKTKINILENGNR